MTSKEKQRNRYLAAERRILHPIYPQNAAARQLCKLDEQHECYAKSIDKVFADMYRRGFRPGIDNQNPAFFADFNLINQWMNECERIARRVKRIEKTNGITTDEALQHFALLNKGRGSQSF